MTCIFWNILMGFIYHSHFLMKHFLVHISISKWRIAHLQFFPSSSSYIFSYLQFLHGRVIWKYLRSTSIQVQKFAPIFHDILTQILAKACIFPSFNGKAAVSSRAIERKLKYICTYITYVKSEWKKYDIHILNFRQIMSVLFKFQSQKTWTIIPQLRIR